MKSPNTCTKQLDASGSLPLFTTAQGHILDGVIREKLWNEHPIVVGSYRLPTPPLVATVDIVLNAIEERVRGVGFYGTSGMGKSCVIAYLKDELELQFPKMPVIEWEALSRKRPNIRDFHKGILEACGVMLLTRAAEFSYEQQVANYLWVRARDANLSHVAMIIDEAQNVETQQWRWLKTIINLLKKQHVSCTVVPFGDHVLQGRRELLQASEDNDLVNRFMPMIHPFHGIRSAAELREVLHWYDVMDFPRNSGVSFAGFFCSESAPRGWTIASEAAYLWEALTSVAGCTVLGVGMEGIALAVQSFLIQAHQIDCANYVHSKEYWQRILVKRPLPVERPAVSISKVEKSR